MLDWITIDNLTLWLENYGTITLFVLLALGIIALPVPEETILIMTGVWLSKSLFVNPTMTILAAIAGSVCGITGSYLIGRNVSFYFLHRSGGWIGITEEKIQRAHIWFEKYGKWSLFFGYFVPGIRHLTGILSGLTELEYKHFALFAYTGAIVWVSTFLSIGYFFGDRWISFIEHIDQGLENHVLFALLAVIFLVLLYYAISSRKKK